MDPPFYFVRDEASRAAHHWDYLRNRRATALCGHDYAEIQWEGTVRPAKVCRQCQDVLPRFEAKWWRKEARRADAHGDRLEKRNTQLESELSQLRRQMNQLTYQLELSKETIESQKTMIDSQKATMVSQLEKIDNQRKTLHRLQTARTSKKSLSQKPSPTTGSKPANEVKPKSASVAKTGVWRSANQVFSSGGTRHSNASKPR